MWEEKKPGGKVKYYERYKDPLTGLTKTATMTIASTGRKRDRQIAEEALKRKIAQITAVGQKPDDLTFQELCRRRVEWQKRNCKLQTAVSSESYLRTLTRIVGPETLVKRLTASSAEQAIGCDNPVTYNERLKHFKSLIHWGYRYDLIDDISYLDKMQRRKEPPVREKDKFKYLEREEITKLLAGMKEERWRLLTEFLILSGLRIGEAIALLDEDLDTKTREISVNKTYAIHTDRISSTKTDTSDRIVYMQDELLECVKKIKAFVKQSKVRFAFQSDIFFPDDDGAYIKYDSYRQYFGDYTQRLIGRRLTPHALRHTHTAMLAEAGIPLEAISRRLGHADSRITREVYLHVTEKMEEREREKIRQIQIL